MNYPDRVLFHLQKAIELRPDYAAPHYQLALLLQEQNEVRESRACFKKSIDVAQKCAIKLAKRAQYYKEQRQFERAKSCLLDVHDHRAIAALANYQIGIMLLAAGNGSAAQRHFKQAVDQDPALADAYYQLGLLAKNTKQADKARDHFENTILLDYNHAAAHYELAHILRSDEDHELAQNHYLIALDLNQSLKDPVLEQRFRKGP
ncbi:MAG: tetratricopeptide repeat protein [Candidatus Marinimicrobia bacterium]|nr:tetratricopeptide repeat protein [Candidatus Neomarinimicrobiota bacterium]